MKKKSYAYGCFGERVKFRTYTGECFVRDNVKYNDTNIQEDTF